MRRKLLWMGLTVGVLVGVWTSLESREGRKYLGLGVFHYGGPLHAVFPDQDKRLTFMLRMTSELTGDVSNYCIERLHHQLKSRGLAHAGSGASANELAAIQAMDAVLTPSGEDPYGGLRRLTQDAVQNPGNPVADECFECDPCETALEGCGNCHLPRVNNCNYTVTYKAGADLKQVTGRVVERGADSVTIQQGETRQQVRLPAKDIVKSDWLDGGDPLWTWWDFQSFGHRGQTATKMLDIVHEHKVACTNCHLRHGDFRLTPEGERFHKDETVIKKVPLEHLLPE